MLVSEFITTALLEFLFPENIYYESFDPDVVCIHLVNLNNRRKAAETRRMLKAYTDLKPRKCSEKGSERHRFLQALKRSPYITILPHSTKDKKFIILKGSPTMLRGPVGFTTPSESPSADDTLVPQSIGEVVGNPPTPILHGDFNNMDSPEEITDDSEQNSDSMNIENNQIIFGSDEDSEFFCQLLVDSVATAGELHELRGEEFQVLQPLDPAGLNKSV